jgi:acyl-CoA thioester hydrolase
VSHVYNARVRVCHGDLDAFGRAHASAYLRHLAQVAIDASTAAGFDAAWYETVGARWLVRRTTFAVGQPARADTTLALRTWVEDFRRVRSRRRYEASGSGDVPALTAVTDWVFVDLATGRPRRVPPEMEARFGVPAESVPPRPPSPNPPAPPASGRTVHRVRWIELDALGHMNNASYLDVLTQGALDVLHDLGWPVERLTAAGSAPWVARGDIEYLDEVRAGDSLETATWFGGSGEGLDVHQTATRLADGRPVAHATTRWHWAHARTDAPAPPPEGLAAAVACAAV